MRTPLLLFFFLSVTAFSQYGHFKKQYDVFDWKVLRTKNLNIHYVEGYESVAEFTAQNAENALKSIRHALLLPFSTRLNIFVYGSHNDFQQTNIVGISLTEGVKGLTEGYQNRVLLPFEGDYNYYRIVIHHELVHAYLNQYFDAESMFPFGRHYMPSWLNEGLATYLSEGDLDCASDMHVRSYLLGTDSKPLDEEYGSIRYSLGQAFYTWLKRNSGPEVIGLLIKQIATRSSLDAAFRSAIGSGYKITIADFTADLLKMYRNENSLFKSPDAYSEMLVRPKVKGSSSYCGAVAISPDGGQLAYVGNDNEEFGVYLRSFPIGFESTKIISGWQDFSFQELLVGDNAISWSPDGKSLSFVAKTDGYDVLYVYDVRSGTALPYKTEFKTIRDVAWSADGAYMALVCVNNQRSDIFTLRLSDKSVTRITDDIYTESSLCWSKDNKLLYFISNRDSVLTSTSNEKAETTWFADYSSSDIYSIDITSRRISRITNEPRYNKRDIHIAPEKDALLYIADNNGINNIYQLDLAQKTSKHITNSSSGIVGFTIDGKAKTLLFTALNNSGSDIYSISKPYEYASGGDTLFKTTCRLYHDNSEYFSFADTSTAKKDSVSTQSKYMQERVKMNTTFGSKKIVVKQDSFLLKNFTEVATEKGREYSPGFVYKDHDVFVDFDDIRMAPTLNTNLYFSDEAGDHNWGFYANISSPYIGYDKVTGDLGYYLGAAYEYKKQLLDYNLSAYHLSYIFPSNISEYGGRGDVSYVINENSRITFGTMFIAASESRLYENDFDPLFNFSVDTSALYSTFDATYLYNNWRREGMSAQNGTYARFRLRLAPKISEGGGDFGLLNIDVRKYIPIWRSGLGFMARLAMGTSFGNDAMDFHVGGIDGWLSAMESNRNYDGSMYGNLQDIVFNQRQNLRGYNIDEVNGKSYVVGTLELRFPFINPIRALTILYPQLWSLSDPISMASLYFDMGTAFNSTDEIGYRAMQRRTLFQYPYEYFVVSRGTMLKSLGLSMSFNFLGLDMRFDIVAPYFNGEFLDKRYLISVGEYF